MARSLYEHPGLILALRAAREWGVRPTKFLRWSARDRIMAQALIAYESQVDPETGLPMFIAEDSDRRFVVDEHMNRAAAVLHGARKNSGDDVKPGVTFRVIDGGLLDDKDE